MLDDNSAAQTKLRHNHLRQHRFPYICIYICTHFIHTSAPGQRDNEHSRIISRCSCPPPSHKNLPLSCPQPARRCGSHLRTARSRPRGGHAVRVPSPLRVRRFRRRYLPGKDEEGRCDVQGGGCFGAGGGGKQGCCVLVVVCVCLHVRV